MADIKPIKPIKLCVNITIPTIDDDSISLYECVGILGNKLQEAIQKINESLGSLEGAYTADNPPPYPVTSVNGKTGAVVIDIPANVYTEDNPPPYPVTSVNRAETKDVITVFEPEGGSIEDVSQAELIAACKAGARLGAFNQDNGTCRLYHFNLYVDPERVDYKEVAGGGASGVTSVNNQTGAVNIFNAPISAATAESVTALNASTNTKINQLKNDVTAITPDDTVVNGKPWSSKKTVDALCMPLEATGNPVTVYPVEGYPLGVKVSWKPTQEGEGDPSPDNIRPISGRDAVSVTRCGKNLINVNPTIYFDAPGRTYNLNTHNIVSGVYTLSCDTDNKNATVYIQFVGVGGKMLTFSTLHDLPCTVTLNETCVNVKAVFSSSNVSGTTCTISNIQLEMGETATPYEPYTGSTTDIPLPETVYGGTLDVETGVVTVDKVMIALTGSEYWRFRDSSNYPNTFLNVFGKRIITGTCTHYKSIDATELNRGDDGIYLTRTKDIIITDHRFDTVEAFKAYLAEQYAAGTPVKICYETNTPYTIQLTGRKIAALSGVNTLYTDAVTLTVTGREDPRHTIVTLTDRIAALESAAAGV